MGEQYNLLKKNYKTHQRILEQEKEDYLPDNTFLDKDKNNSLEKESDEYIKKF